MCSTYTSEILQAFFFFFFTLTAFPSSWHPEPLACPPPAPAGALLHSVSPRQRQTDSPGRLSCSGSLLEEDAFPVLVYLKGKVSFPLNLVLSRGMELEDVPAAVWAPPCLGSRRARRDNGLPRVQAFTGLK